MFIIVKMKKGGLNLFFWKCHHKAFPVCSFLTLAKEKTPTIQYIPTSHLKYMQCISYSLITWNLPKVYFFYWSYDTFEYFLCLQLLSHWYLIAIIFFLTESKWYLDVFCNAVLFSLFVLKLRQVLLLSTINFLYLPFLHKKFFFSMKCTWTYVTSYHQFLNWTFIWYIPGN